MFGAIAKKRALAKKGAIAKREAIAKKGVIAKKKNDSKKGAINKIICFHLKTVLLVFVFILTVKK